MERIDLKPEDAKEIFGLEKDFSSEMLNHAYMQSVAEVYSEDVSEEQKTAKLNRLTQAFNVLSQKTKEQHKNDLKNAFLQSSHSPSNESKQLQIGATETSKVCPECGKLSPENALNCIHCQFQLARFCLACGQIVNRSEQTCPRCGVVMDDYDKQTFLKIYSVEQRVEQERKNSQLYVDKVNRENRAFMARGIVVWLIIISVCFLFLVLAVYIYGLIA